MKESRRKRKEGLRGGEFFFYRGIWRLQNFKNGII
jgi:hypothetical protein